MVAEEKMKKVITIHPEDDTNICTKVMEIIVGIFHLKPKCQSHWRKSQGVHPAGVTHMFSW